ncbi:hypothetical protein LXL04_000899 [Taraxacum kok-saghyz]
MKSYDRIKDSFSIICEPNGPSIGTTYKNYLRRRVTLNCNSLKMSCYECREMSIPHYSHKVKSLCREIFELDNQAQTGEPLATQMRKRGGRRNGCGEIFTKEETTRVLFVFSKSKRLQSADHICKALQKKRWSKVQTSAVCRKKTTIHETNQLHLHLNHSQEKQRIVSSIELMEEDGGHVDMKEAASSKLEASSKKEASASSSSDQLSLIQKKNGRGG